MARAKGFAAWNPQGATIPLLRDIQDVIEEYSDYLPLTVRQIFYRLVGAYGYEKSERFYNSVQEKCNRARRSGRISFRAIRDDGVSRSGGEPYTYASPRQYLRMHDELDNYYERSWHADQPVYVAMLCEASGMVPMLSRAVSDYRIEVASSSGFDSTTAKHDLFASALRRYADHAQTTLLLHLGDHDPSGVWMHESMAEDLGAFARDFPRAPDDLIELRRVAITPSQIIDLDITTQPEPPKPNGHGKAFIERGLEPAAQLEAIPPDTLSELARQAVETSLDLDILALSRRLEEQERAVVQVKIDQANEALREIFGEG